MHLMLSEQQRRVCRRVFSGMQQCMHFADNWEEEDKEIWDDYFSNMRIGLLLNVAHRWRKLEIIVDAFNARWTVVVMFG